MKKITYILIFIVGFSCTKNKKQNYAQTKEIQLVPPNFTVDSIFFKNNATINFSSTLANTTLKYSVGNSSITHDSKILESPLKIEKSSTLAVKAFHTDYKESETVKLQVKKIKHNISNASIRIFPEPSDTYSANGAASLTDLKSGYPQFKKNNAWLGFNTKEISINVVLDKPLLLSKITLHILTAQGDWIFAPEQISIKNNNKVIGELVNKKASKKSLSGANVNFTEVPITPKTYNEFTIVVKSLNGIPNWHSGANSTPWFFIDEIIVE
ncbi:hypothetical protein AX016_3225 [Cellulophaga sp. RHA19]|uniref:hypothetical protein n=1 Tax=Cellulophaga sp. RHA19 TaxID=1798237 RepID=UPI000C2B793B|nr:hypothetical protein [Cellulophaga sp. RHA19]PKB44992.1 hypothetical protein AX016_3225 [Cellulophaga sp. RHA19]